MSLYKSMLNPHTGNLTIVWAGTVLHMHESVDTYNSLPITGNSENDLRITRDTDIMWTWSISSASGSLSDWKDIGSIAAVDWSAITNKPSSSVADIDDAVSKKHTQGTDQKLDDGGVNEISAEEIKNFIDISAIDSSIKLLYHFNGDNEDIDTIDETRVTSPTLYTDCIISTSESKFGGTSLKTSNNLGYTGYLDALNAGFACNIFEDLINSATVSFWFKYNTIESKTLISYGTSRNVKEWRILSSPTSGIRFYLDAVSGDIDSGYNGMINDTNWHHIAIVKNANVMAIYLDGQQIHYIVHLIAQDDPNGTLTIGNNKGGSAPSADGYFDEFLVTNNNYFSASPNSGLTDIITVPTSEELSAIILAPKLAEINADGTPDRTSIVTIDVEDAVTKKHAENSDSLFDEKADKDNVLELDSPIHFNPGVENHPVTKRYVDLKDNPEVYNGHITHIDTDYPGGYGRDVWGDGKFIYLANGIDGLFSYSVDTVGNLTKIDTDDPGQPYGVWGDGKFLYVANGNGGGICSYSVDSLGNLTKIDSDSHTGYNRGVWGDGKFVYLTNDVLGLMSYSVDDSGNLTHLDTDQQTGNAIKVWGDGKFVYVVNGTLGLMSYSVDDLGNLSLIDSDSNCGTAVNVWGDGKFVYVVNGSGHGLYSYSVDTAGNLTLVDSDVKTNTALGVWGDGKFVYVANETLGLMSYFVDDSGNLTYLDADAATELKSVWGDGKFVYGTDISGIRSYSIDKAYEYNKGTEVHNFTGDINLSGTINSKAVEDIVISSEDGDWKKVTSIQFNSTTEEIRVFYES